MLYDPKWEQKTKADPLSLESLIAWLEQQPAGRSYDFAQPSQCLLAQYRKYTNATPISLNCDRVRKLYGEHFMDIIRPNPMTFGAALKRARAAYSKGLGNKK